MVYLAGYTDLSRALGRRCIPRTNVKTAGITVHKVRGSHTVTCILETQSGETKTGNGGDVPRTAICLTGDSEGKTAL